VRTLLSGVVFLLGACAVDPPQAPPADKELAKASYERGIALRGKNDHPGAIREFDEAIRLDSAHVEAYIDRGQSRRDRKEYALAFADFDTAIRLDPSFARAHVNRGYTRYVMGEYDRAIASYDEAIRLGLNGAHYERANAWFAKGDRKRAVADFSAALRDDRRGVLEFLGRVSASDSRTERERALAAFGEAIRLEPHAADGYYARGGAWYGWGDYSRAIADFAEVIRLDPQHSGAYGATAWVLATAPDATVRDGRQAVQFARRACDLTEWKSPYAIQTLAVAHAEANEYPEAIRWIEEALKFPDFARDSGDAARGRLALFRANQPYRHGPAQPQ
jgi:tetratricopeptide (TPR) repeat protein